MSLLWLIVIVLLIFWLLGAGLHLGGNLIHFILVVIVIIVLVNFVQNRRGGID